MILKKLNQLKSKNELITLERKSLTQEEISGFVHFFNDEIIVIKMYSEGGYFDGYSAFNIDQITEIFWGNREHKSNYKIIVDENIKATDFNIELLKKDFVSSIFSIANNLGYIEIYCEYFTETGFDIAKIIDHDAEWLNLDCLGTKNSLSKMKRLLKIENITRIDFETPYLHDIVKLHNIKPHV